MGKLDRNSQERGGICTISCIDKKVHRLVLTCCFCTAYHSVGLLLKWLLSV